MQLIVLGMHRSGTSSVTRLLNLAGAYFGPEGSATDPNAENPKGFWERRDVRAVCDGLLLSGGFDWWRVAGFTPDAIPTEERERLVADFGRIVFDLDAHRPWVMKEPRLCLLLPVLRDALEAPVFVHVAREPLEIAQSLEARNDIPIAAGLALWECYTVHAYAASAGGPEVFVSYADLVNDPVATTAQLVEQLQALGVLGLHVPTEREIVAFVEPQLHRQRREERDRVEYLNPRQVALARAGDKRRRPSRSEISHVSAGALKTLRTFEEREALTQTIQGFDQEMSDLRADLEATHREIEAGIRAQAAEALHELELVHGERLERLQAESADRHRAELADRQRATASLESAARRIKAVRRSRVVRVAVRGSHLRAKLRRRSPSGVDTAVGAALRDIDAARAALSDNAAAEFVDADAAAPSVAEMQLRRRAARARGDRAKVAVLAWDVGHNPFGRAHLLADLISDHFDVELWGPQFERYGSDIWLPMRDTKIPVRKFEGCAFPEFMDVMDAVAGRIEADALWVSKPRLPALGIGIRAAQLWKRPLIVDIDDFEPSFFDESVGLDPEELRARQGEGDLELPFGRLWTQACEYVVRTAAEITVSNGELQERYGGTIVPHARDERIFDPDRFDRRAERHRLGLRDDDRLIVFGGTARIHKGIVELLQAVDSLGDDRIRVGAFGTRELHGLQAELGPLMRWILPLPRQSFDDLPATLVAADLACALQSPSHPVSRYQMPAKVTDAMAMGVPCLVTPVPPLQAVIDKDVVEVFDGDGPLVERLRSFFAHRDEALDRARRARELFLEAYSYQAVRPVAVATIERHLENPPPVAPALSDLVRVAREMAAPNAGTGVTTTAKVVPAVRRPMPSGSTYDLLVFWKQNDSGLYGRRHDMFVKYLERSGRFGTILHFDQPMSAEALLKTAKDGLRSDDQNRFVAWQTLRRAAVHPRKASVHEHTFVYAAGPWSRRLRFPRKGDYPAFVQRTLAAAGVGERPIVCLVYPTSTVLPAVLDAIRPDIVVTDLVDDNRAWYRPGTPGYATVEENYRDVLQRSDIVLANCTPLAEGMRAYTSEIHVVPNACELSATENLGPRPRELQDIRGPIVGYAGNLSGRIDLDLLRGLVRARPDWTFVFVGSTHFDKSVLDLRSASNVRFIGTKPYDEAQRIIGHFDVALIPHLDNEMSRSMNPLKAYVYASLGVPVVSTPVANLDELSDFFVVAEGLDQFIDAIEAALRAGRRVPDPERLAPHSWPVRVAQVLDLVDAKVAERRDLTTEPGET